MSVEQPSGVDPRLSLLKLLAAFAVVIVHTTMVRVSLVDIHSLGWWVANAADGAGRFGSSMFAMVAGAVLLARPSERDPGRFIWQRLERLLPAVVFWSVFYFLWRQWMWGGITWSVVGHDLLLGVGEGRGWIYLLLLAAGMTWFASIAQTLQQLSHASFVGLVPFFAVYCWAGYYLLRKPVEVPAWILVLVIGLCVAMMAVGVAWSYPQLQGWAFVLFYSNRSPWAMVLTVSLFLLVLRLPRTVIPAWVNRLGAATLGVYAIHPFWIDMLARWGWSLQRAGDAWILLTCLVFALSMLTSLCISAIPGMRRLVS